MKKFALIALTAAALALAALLLIRMAPRRGDPLRGAEVVRVVRRDLERVVTAAEVQMKAPPSKSRTSRASPLANALTSRC